MLAAVVLLPIPAAAVMGVPSALAACSSGLWQNVRYVDGTWLGWDQPPQPPGGLGGPIANAAVGSGNNFTIHVDIANSRGIWDNAQYQTGVNGGNWQGWAQPTQPPGTVQYITDAAEPDGSMQMIAVTTTGLYHDIRYPNGTWQGWGEPAQPPVNLQDIGMYTVTTGMADGDMVTVIGAPGGLFYADVRFASGLWSGWSQIPGVPGNGFDIAISGDKNGALQLMAINAAPNATAKIYHNIWYSPPTGGWQGWTQTTQPPDVGWSQLVTAATTPDGDTQFVDLIADPNVNQGNGQLYGDIRHIANGSWQGWQQMSTPPGPVGGIPIAAPTWVSFGADEVWADSPVHCGL